MIQSIAVVALLVKDYDEAIKFYCEVLGFEVKEDTQLENKRWIKIRPSSQAGVELLLSKAVSDEQLSVVGRQAGGRVFLFLQTNNIHEDLIRLKSHHVEIQEELSMKPYGKLVVFKDLYGNRIDLIEPI